MKNEEITKEHLVKELAKLRREITQVNEETERKSESKEHYHSLLDISPDAIVETGLDGKILFCNQQASKMHGYESPSDLIGQDSLQFMHEEDIHIAQKNAELLLDKGYFKNMTYRMRKKDGTSIPVEVSASLLTDDKGSPKSFIGYIRDITERKNAEIELAERSRFIESLINLNPDIIYIYDLVDRKNVYSNDGIQTMLGYSVEEVQKMGNEIIPILMHPDDLKVYIDETFPRYSITPDNELISHQYRMQHNNGNWHMLESTELIYKRQPDGSPHQIFGVIHDITERKKAEEKLLKSEDIYRSFVQNFQGIAFRGDLNFTPIFFHGAVKEITGYHEKDFTSGKPRWDQVMHPDDLPDFLVEVTEKIISVPNFSSDREYRIIRKDGEIRWVQERIQNICDNSRKPIYVQGTIYDITERKKNEDVIEKIFNMTGYMVCTADLKGNFTRVNKSFEQILGYTAEELLGQPYINLIHPDDKQKTLDVIENEMSQGIKIVGFENRYRCKDRTYKWLSWSAQPDPKTGESYAIAYDITERKKLDDMLRLQSAIMMNMDEGVNLSRAGDLKLIYVNPKFEEMFGYSSGELIGKHVSVLNDPTERDAQDIEQKILESININNMWMGEIKNIRKDGTTFYSLANISMFNHPEHGKVFVSVQTDITERREAEEEQERLAAELIIKNKELEQVLYVTSHDLRSPLVNVEGYGRELEYSLRDLMSSIDDADVPSSVKDKITPIVKEDIPESLHYIQTSVSKMSTLLKGILTLSRLGSADLAIAEIDVNEMMNEIVDNHRFRLNELKIKTEVSKLPNCKGDSSQINQVFSNLLDNAIKYADSERSCVIHISGYKEGNQSVYCIEDNGIGIAPEHQDKIFEIFHQLEPNRVKGEGLGLTIAHRIIEKQYGKIWVESELGKGSKFFVSLPS